MVDVNLASLVETLAAAAMRARQQRSGAGHHALSIEIDPSVTMHAPKIFLHVLMHNLITNALDHAAGPIRLQADQQGFYITNPVNDESRSSSGYGYGLIISERICERMRWQLEVTNDVSQFTVAVAIPPAK